MAVDDLPLLVHHIVVFQQLPDFEIVCLDLALGIFNGSADEFVLDGLAFLHAQFFHDSGDAFPAEDSQQIILQGQIKARRSRVPCRPDRPLS